MKQLGRILLTTTLTTLSPFLAYAQNAQSPTPVAEPLRLEELPAKAIIRVNRPGHGTYMLADGSMIRVAKDKKSLELLRFSQIRKIELPTEVSSIHSRGKGLMLFYGKYNEVAKGSDIVIVHLKSGRVHVKGADESAYLMNLGELQLLQTKARFETIDTETGELKLLRERSATTTNGYSWSNVETSMGTIVTLDGIVYLVDKKKNSWTEVKLPNVAAGASIYCHENGDDGLLTCQGNNNEFSYTVYWKDGQMKVISTDKKTILASDMAASLMISVPELRSADPKLLETLTLTNLETGKDQQFKFRSVEPTGKLEFFFRLGPNKILFWYKNKDVEIVDRENFWKAFRAKKLMLAKGTGRLLGNARGMPDLTPMITGEYSDSYSRQSNEGWSVKIQDGVMEFAPAGSKDVKRVFIGSQPSYSMIPRTDFALLSFRASSTNFSVIYDLRNNKAYEIGAGYVTLDTSDRGDQLLIQRSPDEWLISIPLIRALESWRKGPLVGLAHEELSAEVINQCVPTAQLPPEQGLAAELLRLRQLPAIDELGLRYVLAYRLNQGELVMVSQILQKWLATSPEQAMLAFRRLDLFERLKELNPGWSTSPCLTASEKSIVQSQVKQAFTEVNDNNLVGTDINSFQHLIALAPLIKEMGYANENSEDIVISKLAKAAEMHPQLMGVFPSKLYYFSKAVVNPIFGRAIKFKTDVTVNQDKKVSHLTLMSTMPAYGQKVQRNSFGFYHGVIDSVELKGEVGSKVTKRVEWRSRGQKYAADVTLTKSGDLSGLVPKASGLDYASINKDKKLIGLMVVGTNLGKMHSDMTMSQYEYFFRQEGYKFEPAGQVANSLEFMKNLVQSGDLDFMVKEAHSDGDEKNLFRAPRVGELRIGRKVNLNSGREETVYLLSPKYGPSGEVVRGDEAASDDLIPNQLFGEWVRTREAAEKGPLIYLNASCTSSTKVINEITAARSKLLVAIPSVTAISMFRNRQGNSTAVFLQGIYEGLDWAAIRKRMEIDPEVKEERNNVFALPNEDRFDRSIRQSLGFTVDSQVELMDLKLNRRFSVDEFNRDH